MIDDPRLEIVARDAMTQLRNRLFIWDKQPVASAIIYVLTGSGTNQLGSSQARVVIGILGLSLQKIYREEPWPTEVVRRFREIHRLGNS